MGQENMLKKLLLANFAARGHTKPFVRFSQMVQGAENGQAGTAGAVNLLERLRRRAPGIREEFQLHLLRAHQKDWKQRAWRGC